MKARDGGGGAAVYRSRVRLACGACGPSHFWTLAGCRPETKGEAEETMTANGVETNGRKGRRRLIREADARARSDVYYT